MRTNLGKPVVQLDYESNEVIGEYKSIEEAAKDNWLSRDGLSKALIRHQGIMNRKKLRFQYK